MRRSLKSRWSRNCKQRFMKKKKNRPYPRSFAKRLTWRIMATMLVVMGLVSVLIFSIGRITVAGSTELLARRFLSGKNENLQRVLSEVRVASINSVPFIEENLDKPEKLYDIMKLIVSQNPRIRSCGISFTADYYPQKGHWFCPYAVRCDSATIEVKTIGSKQQDYLHKEWFTQAIVADSGFWSKPFTDGTDHSTPLVSWLSPIHNKQGQTVAVLGADLSLEWLTEKIQFIQINDSTDNEWSAEYNPYFFAIDSDGTYIVHPDQKRIARKNYFDYAKATPDNSDDYLGRKLLERKKSYIDEDDAKNDIVLEGENVDVVKMPVEQTNWTVAFVIPSIFIDLVGYFLGGLMLLFIVVGLLVVFFAGRHSIKKAVKPLKQLSASADEVAKGHFDTVLPTISSRDEIHQLRDSFEKMQTSLTKYIDELKDTTAQKASIESELKIAHNIQMSMLPKTFPPFPDRDDIDVYGMLKPAKDVGGDLFDFYIRDDRLFFCIGDVSGKGVPASLFMAVTRSLFRNVSNHEQCPDRIVKILNAAIIEDNDSSMFVTLFIGVLNLTTGQLQYCNAGHEAPLLVADGVSALPCDPNLPVGVIPDWEYTLQTANILPGTAIFLYTDGLNEAENATHQQFGEERITDLLKNLQAAEKSQPKTVITKMADAVNGFVGEAEQSDDLTILAIKYKKQHV